MSERPFMQLYVSDFIGDTLQLSTEQIGAYMLMLMAMWNAGGKLPADDAKLARVVRMSVKKWRAISGDLMAYFDGDSEHIWHNRLTKELRKSEAKSQVRAAAGAKGGASKPLKNIDTAKANAEQMPKHLPEARSQKVAPQPRADDLLDRLLDAAGVKGNPPTGLAFPGEIIGLMQAGYDLDQDILPAIRARPNPKARTWAYFVPQIRDAADRRSAIASEAKPEAKEIDWLNWCRVFFKGRHWANGLGPDPDDPACEAPPEIIAQARREIQSEQAA